MAFRNLSKCLGCYCTADHRSYMPKGIKKSQKILVLSNNSYILKLTKPIAERCKIGRKGMSDINANPVGMQD